MSGFVEFIKSPSARIYAVEAVVGLIGALVNFINFFSAGASMNAFLFWTTFIISATILALTYNKFMEILRAKFPFLDKAILIYLGLYSILYILASIVSFFSFGVSSIFGYFLVIVYIFHTYTMYNSLRSESPAPQTDVEAPAAPKY